MPIALEFNTTGCSREASVSSSEWTRVSARGPRFDRVVRCKSKIGVEEISGSGKDQSEWSKEAVHSARPAVTLCHDLITPSTHQSENNKNCAYSSALKDWKRS